MSKSHITKHFLNIFHLKLPWKHWHIKSDLLLMADRHLGVWGNLDSFRPISRLPLSVDTNTKIRGIEWEFPTLVLASNKMHKEELLFLCGPPPIDVHPYTPSKYTKPNVKSQRENFCQQPSCTHSRSHSHTSHRSSIWNSALCLRWALRDGPQGGQTPLKGSSSALWNLYSQWFCKPVSFSCPLKVHLSETSSS